VIAMLADLPRPQLELVIDGLIGMLDARDGDPDFEPEQDIGADDLGEPDDTWRDRP
jgi:hypothetical protein